MAIEGGREREREKKVNKMAEWRNAREKKRWNWLREKEKDGNSGKEETGRFRAEDVEMEFELQKKLIELEGEGHFARACLDIEVSTDRGNIGNEVRSNLSSETIFKTEVETRLKADEEAKAVKEGRKMEEERCKRMNEQNQLLNEEQEKLLSDEDMEVLQAIEKVLVFKGEQVQTRRADQYTVAQSVAVEKEKEETSVDVIKR
ncbi:hypothetical protein TNCV_4057631 [Trichonephila clavipes]|nr:hypothetical protein TNCV_4057631 [Trichonephila clavipes]